LSFAYPAAPALDFQVRVTGPTGTAWTYTPYFDNAPPLAVPPPAAEPALTVLKNIDGEMFTIERRNLTTQALGLSALTLDPLSAGLAALDNAQTVVAEALGYFGATDRSLRGLTGIANAVTDGTGEGLGSMVDADLAAESARLIAAQIRVELSSQGLSIANAAPDHLRQLFSTQD
jgi:flagellin-like hook-associated protein FlgL